MHTNVKLEYDKSNALELPAFEDEEIDFWLNSAIRAFVKTRYSGINFKKESFEESQKRIDDLRTLVVHSTEISYLSGMNDYPNGYLFALPSGYWFALQEEATIAPDSTGVRARVGVTECTIDEYRQQIDDPYSEHILHYNTAKPLRLFNNAAVELISDGTYTITYYHLTYLKKPTEVSLSGSVDCDLPEHTHDEIVKMAVNSMLENVEQPRYQSHTNEVITME